MLQPLTSFESSIWNDLNFHQQKSIDRKSIQLCTIFLGKSFFKFSITVSRAVNACQNHQKPEIPINYSNWLPIQCILWKFSLNNMLSWYTHWYPFWFETFLSRFVTKWNTIFSMNVKWTMFHWRISTIALFSTFLCGFALFCFVKLVYGLRFASTQIQCWRHCYEVKPKKTNQVYKQAVSVIITFSVLIQL